MRRVKRPVEAFWPPLNGPQSPWKRLVSWVPAFLREKPKRQGGQIYSSRMRLAAKLRVWRIHSDRFL